MEELKHLIERVRTEAVDAGERQAEDILSQARQKAATLVSDAEDKAAAILKKAEQDASVYVDRSRKTLEQAARDLLITVGQGVENIFTDLVEESVGEAMDIDVLKQMLSGIAMSCVAQGGECRFEILVNEKDREKLVKYFAGLYRQKLIPGIELRTDNDILNGFRISYSHDHVYLDFTSQAIADSMAQLLRPRLAEIVRHASEVKEGIEKACVGLGCEDPACDECDDAESAPPVEGAT